MLSKASLPQPGKILALLGTYLASFGEGMCVGFPISSKGPWEEVLKQEVSKTWFHLLLPVGAVLGSLTNSVCNNRFGRNKTITVGACQALVALALLVVASQSLQLWALYLGVVMMGAACGVVSHTAPTYLHEVSQPESRGKTVAGHPAAVAIGLSLSLLIGPLVSVDVLTCFSVLPFVFSAVVLALSPASPLWLAEKNRPKEEIEHALTKLHGPTSYAQNELQLLTTRRVQIFSNSVRTPSVNRPLIISMGLMLLQQLSGVSGMIAIFNSNENISRGVIIAFSVTHIIVSLIAVFLHDVIGRKTLLYISTVTELVGLIVLGVSWGTYQLEWVDLSHATPGIIVGVTIFIGGYSIGSGPVPWVMLNELLPSRAKTFATAASTTTNWIFDTIMTEVFTFLLKWIGGSYTFVIFSFFVVVSFVFVYLFVPETSGLTIEQLEKMFRDLYEKLFLENNDNNSRSVVINEMENDEGAETQSQTSNNSNS